MIKLVEKKKLPQSKIEVIISAQAEDFQKVFSHEVEEIAKELKIPGFRPGKAPQAKVIEAIGRSRIESSALDKLLNDAYATTMRENDLLPVASPNVKVESFIAPDLEAAADKEVLQFKATVEVLPVIDISGYKKLKIKAPTKEEVSEKEYQEVLTYLKKQQSNLTEALPETPVKKGMWADIAFSGSVDKVKKSNMQAEHHPLIIGDGNLIPGFEEELIGLKTGESKTFAITFPKDYHTQELTGKKAEFEVKINELKEVTLPEVDDTLAKSYGQPSLAKLEANIRADLQKEKDRQHKIKLDELVAEALLKLIKFDIPESLIERERHRLMDEAKEHVAQMKIEWATYLEQSKQTEAQFNDDLKVQADKNARLGLILGEIIQEEGIKDDNQAGRLALDKIIEIATK